MEIESEDKSKDKSKDNDWETELTDIEEATEAVELSSASLEANMELIAEAAVHYYATRLPCIAHKVTN